MCIYCFINEGRCQKLRFDDEGKGFFNCKRLHLWRGSWIVRDPLRGKILIRVYNWTIIQMGELKDLTNRSVWSKTTLIPCSVGGAGVDPPCCNTGQFFIRSLALNVPIYRNFQSNGAKWQSLKLWTKNYTIPYFFSKFETSPFSSIWLEILINLHTKSQGPKEKCTRFTRGR